MSVCGVCPSVTFVDHVKTNKHIFEIFSPLGSHSILVFPYQTGWRYSYGNPPNGSVECRWGIDRNRNSGLIPGYRRLLNCEVPKTFTDDRQIHLGVGKSEYNPPFSGLRAASTWEAVGFCGNHRQTDVLAKLSSWLGGWSPFCGDNGKVRERRSLRCRHLWVGG